MRTLATLVVSLTLAASAVPAGVGAQSVVVGAVGGRTESRLTRDREADSEAQANPLAGAWVEVSPGGPFVAILAEATWSRRGGAYPAAFGEIGGTGVRADYLTATVAPTLRLGVGALSVYAYGGPTMELHVRTSAGSQVSAAFRDPAAQTFAVTAGAGAAVRFGAWEVRGEAREVVGLSSAYTHDEGDFGHRATEVLVRVGWRGGR
ncbi:MAG: hypothetical protein AMXMBFR53_30870 [Gemmatimonadota bacterium]